MNGDYLLDTNIVIALFANEAGVSERLAKAETTHVPAIVLGELYYGALKSSRAKENLERIADLVANADILDCDSRTARLFGEVKDRLRQKGRPIPENDIWIAAMALQYDLTLISRDAHFSEVENLKLESW